MMMETIQVKTPVHLYAGDVKVGSAMLEACIVPDTCVAAVCVVDVEFLADAPVGVPVQAHFASALEGIAYIAGQAPERIGKDC